MTAPWAHGLLVGALLAMPLLGHAAPRNCDSIKTDELQACAWSRAQESDRTLNTTYQRAMQTLPEAQRKPLLTAQRAWVAYKEAYCKQVFDDMHPGREAGIHQALCVEHASEQRTLELQWLMGEHNPSFGHVMNALDDLGYSRSEMRKKLAERAAPAAGGKAWQRYLRGHCEMGETLRLEEPARCAARLNALRD
jgi:uncharacterized protein YecT (DUF1311 family)